jgi:hypothetical protein
MNRTDVVAWVLSACANCLRLSQVKTLSVLVAAALHVQRVSLANIARAMQGTVKGQVKRCWRFCANPRIETADAMKGVIAKLLKKRKKNLLVGFDWTDIRGFHTLLAAAVIKGRSIPLCWASCVGNTFEGHRSRNAFEESLLLVLRSMIPDSVKVTILADRGFGRTELARFCVRNRFHFIFRVQPDVWVKGAGYSGKLLDYPVYRGMAQVLKNVSYRQEKPVMVNVAIRWRKDLPQERDECWFLISDLNLSAQRISQLYGKRMTIEELFRDGKNKRNGWSLRDTQITRPDRIDRLLLILALAYLLLCGVGLRAQAKYRPSAWCSSNKPRVCSVFFIGRVMLTRFELTPKEAFDAVRLGSLEATPKWG